MKKNEETSVEIGREFANDLLWGHEAGVYAEDDWTLSSAVRLNAGLRFSLFNVQGKDLYRTGTAGISSLVAG